MSKYYKLPKDKQWLPDGNSPGVIGGRDTDISCIGHNLRDIVFGLEKTHSFSRSDMLVLRGKIHLMINMLDHTEELIQDVINTTSQIITVNNE